MRRLVVIALALAAAAVAVPALAGSTQTYKVNVPKKLRNVIPDVKRDSNVAVRVPSRIRLPIKPRRLRGFGSGSKGEYSMYLGIGKQCNGARVCTLAYFNARRGAKFTNKTRVTLRGGRRGRYQRSQCAANCSPDSIQWKQRKVLYEVMFFGTKRQMVRAANSAIRAGAR